MVLSKLTGRDFRLLRETKSFKYKTKSFLFVFKLFESSDLHLQYGVTLTKKKLKKAVYRNRIKRLVRESFRKEMNSKEEELHKFSKLIKVNLVFIASDPQKTVDAVKLNDVQNEIKNFLFEVLYKLPK